MIFKQFFGILIVLILINCATVNCGIGLTPWQFFFGNGQDVDKVIPVEFRPDEGVKLREKFEEKYGSKAEKLVQSFGDSSNLEELQKHNLDT